MTRLTEWPAVYSSRLSVFEDAAQEVRERALRDVPNATVEIEDNWPLPKGGYGFRLRRVRQELSDAVS